MKYLENLNNDKPSQVDHDYNYFLHDFACEFVGEFNFNHMESTQALGEGVSWFTSSTHVNWVLGFNH